MVPGSVSGLAPRVSGCAHRVLTLKRFLVVEGVALTSPKKFIRFGEPGPHGLSFSQWTGRREQGLTLDSHSQSHIGQKAFPLMVHKALDLP